MSAHNLAFVLTEGLEHLGELDAGVSHWGVDPGKRGSRDFYLRDKLGPIVTAFSEIFGGVARPTKKLDLAALPVDFDGLSAPGLLVVRYVSTRKSFVTLLAEVQITFLYLFILNDVVMSWRRLAYPAYDYLFNNSWTV